MHVGQHIACSAARAYAFARDPANLPVWAAGLGGAVEQVDGQWRVRTPEGDAVLTFVPVNAFGVLDHTVVLPDGTSVDNPLRVLSDGEGCEVVFTLRRRPSMTDSELEEDAAAVRADLLALKRVLEAPPG